MKGDSNIPSRKCKSWFQISDKYQTVIFVAIISLVLIGTDVQQHAQDQNPADANPPIAPKESITNSSPTAEALGGMKGSAYEAVPDLVEVIKANQAQCLDDLPKLCEFATQALGNIGTAAKDAIPDLVSLLDHQNPYFRIPVAVALTRIQPNNQEALHSISTLLKDQNVDVRRRTIWEQRKIQKFGQKLVNLCDWSKW
jgi:hypothetical protein